MPRITCKHCDGEGSIDLSEKARLRTMKVRIGIGALIGISIFLGILLTTEWDISDVLHMIAKHTLPFVGANVLFALVGSCFGYMYDQIRHERSLY